MTNILAIPRTQMTIESGTNEDWIDSIKFLVDTGDAILPQLDIRGITFEMEVRRSPSAHEVVLAASTVTGTLKIGIPPDYGFLLIHIPFADMRTLGAGTYVADIIGRDQFYTRVIIQIDLIIFEGVTRQPVTERIVVQAA
jgi:hypothetical protein